MTEVRRGKREREREGEKKEEERGRSENYRSEELTKAIE